ncbi:hypothetical protein BKA69DRAFT_727853 [Paraphysoderma sedebokerense]|nr:hypothetical protein BKA69DRAFT_727853 [Paraphysoderma sedebokerense]
MDSRVESFSQGLCFPNGLNPPNIDPTPNYCGVRMVNNFWDQHTYGNLVNMLGGATNGGGQVVTRQQWDCDGIGSGKLYLDPADPVPPATVSPSYYYTVFGPAGRSCFDCTNYPYLSFDVTAGAGTTFNIRLEEGSDDTCNNILPGGGMAIPSTLVHNFTSTNTHTFLIPTMSQSGPRTRLRSLVLDTFVNPSGINLFIDNIKFINPSVRPPLYIDRFNTNGATPPALNGFRARTDDAGSMRVYSISGNRLQLSPRRGNSIWYTELSCLPITQQFPSPALKFEVSADGPVDFDIVLTEGHQNCDPNQPNQIQATRSVQLSSYLNITTDTANLAHTVSIPLSAFNINLQRLHSLQIRQIRPYGVNIYLDDIRFGSADCLEYEPVPYPDYTPKPPYFGFNRNFLTRARRSVSDRTEL